VDFPPIKLPLAFFCLLSVLSVFWAANPAVGWFAARKLVLFLIWLLAVNLIVTERHLRRLLQALFVESALAGVVAAAQFVIQYRAVSREHPGLVYAYMTATRIHGFMGHWMNFGGQQMLVFAALLAFLLLTSRELAALEARNSELGVRGSRNGNRGDLARRTEEAPPPSELLISNPEPRIWWLVLGLIVLSIVLNFTRGVWLGCFVATLYLVARWKARWLWVLPVLVAAAYFASPSLVRRRVWLALHPTQDPPLAIRLEMWRVGLRMIRTHPWLGVGPNNIEQEYPLYLPPGKSPMVGYHSHLHNNFLQFGAERGLPCLAAWVWLMAALGWQVSRIRRKLTKLCWVADAALAAWLALLFEGCFEFNFGTSPVLMVFLFLTAAPFVAGRVVNQVECPESRAKS
jgi:O-antigen ligase